jgi:site-specific recombinase XerD
LVAPKLATKIPHFISVDEALAILQTFKTFPKNPKNQTIQLLFLLLYGAGLRVSEACQLKWESVNLARRELRILGKGQKMRVIAFPTMLQNALAELRGTQREVYIWGAQPLQVRTAYNYIRLVGQRGGLSKPIHPHALRHSFATHLLNDGADLRIIQEMLGHASLNATEKYTHVSISKLSETMENFHPLGKKVV